MQIVHYIRLQTQRNSINRFCWLKDTHLGEASCWIIILESSVETPICQPVSIQSYLRSKLKFHFAIKLGAHTLMRFSNPPLPHD